MHWISGTWLWAKHKSSRSTGAAVYIERDSHSRHNRRQTWSSPPRPQTATAAPSSSSSRARAPSTSTSTSTATSTSSASSRGLYRTESHNNYPYLRCIRCGGVRSRDYHYRHFDDPVKYPSVGICSRERTRCARAKSDPPLPSAPMVYEFAEVHGKEQERGWDPPAGICELPDTSAGLDKLETKSLC